MKNFFLRLFWLPYQTLTRVRGICVTAIFYPKKHLKIIRQAEPIISLPFFKNELIPYIDKKLPTSGDNSLFGHSLGGVFTMYVLLKEPDLFTNYYCSDPAFPWNNRRIITMAEETFKNTTELNKTLWINGVEETYRNVGIAKNGFCFKSSVLPKGFAGKFRSIRTKRICRFVLKVFMMV